MSWTDPARLSLWMAPAGWRCWATVDPRPEGKFRLGMELPGADTIESSGTYEEVLPPHKLTFSWQWEGAPQVTHVDLLFTATNEGTRLDLTHSGLEGPTDQENHLRGWSDWLDRLENFLS